MRFEDDLLAKIDARCELKGRNRSEWVMAALEFVMEQIEQPTAVEKAQLRMRIEPVAGNQTGEYAKAIAEREAGREDRKAVYAAKKQAGLLGCTCNKGHSGACP
jgi:hypothetical protein